MRSTSGASSPGSPWTATLRSFGASASAVGRRHRGAFGVLVEAAPALAAEETGRDQLALDRRRRVARIVQHRFPHARRHREVHVEADQVHQLERPHAEAAGVAQDRVDRRAAWRRGRPASLQRLAVVRARAAVDDEAGRGGRAHRHLAPGARGLDERIGDRGVGRQPADDLDQRQDRRRIEEVQPGHASGMLAAGGERGDRQRRGVAREDRVGVDHDLQVAQQVALGAEVLDDRLDHELRARAIARGMDRRTGARPRHARRPRRACPSRPACRRSHGCRAIASSAAPMRASKSRTAMARLRGDLRDARAHRAGADDGDDGFARQRTARSPSTQRPVNAGGRLATNAATPSR